MKQSLILTIISLLLSGAGTLYGQHNPGKFARQLVKELNSNKQDGLHDFLFQPTDLRYLIERIQRVEPTIPQSVTFGLELDMISSTEVARERWNARKQKLKTDDAKMKYRSHDFIEIKPPHYGVIGQTDLYKIIRIVMQDKASGDLEVIEITTICVRDSLKIGELKIRPVRGLGFLTGEDLAIYLLATLNEMSPAEKLNILMLSPENMDTLALTSQMQNGRSISSEQRDALRLEFDDRITWIKSQWGAQLKEFGGLNLRYLKIRQSLATEGLLTYHNIDIYARDEKNQKERLIKIAVIAVDGRLRLMGFGWIVPAPNFIPGN